MKLDKVKFILKDYYKIITLLKNKIVDSKMSKLRFVIVLDMLIKTVLFLALLEDNSSDTLEIANISFKFTIVYLSFILVFYSFGYLFSKNKQVIFNVVLNVLYSVLLLLDLWYFRANKDFYGMKNILFKGTFNLAGGSLINFRWIDLIFIVDIILIIFWIIIKKVRNNEMKDIAKFSITIRYSLISILLSFICLDLLYLGGWGNYVVERGWTTLMSVRAPGPIGYHLVESAKSIKKSINEADDIESEEIQNWLEYNAEDIAPNEYEGVFNGKNVIFLQVESLENFIINKNTNGIEISPFLNKLSSEGLYFNNVYQQNNAGNSIDCDFMVNTSIFPLGEKITALNYGENTYKNSLPRILQKNGYLTISSHAEAKGEFNWTELHKNGFGVEQLWDISNFNYEETVGYGLSDRSFLSQIADKLKTVKEPFFIQLPTLSNHGPFNIGKEYRELNLPKEIDESYLGGYFESVHYTDKQIEMFFEKLKSSGLLNNTIIVLYGDHAGVHKYYNNDIKNIDFEGNWWKPFDNKIPLIIYGMNVKSKVITNVGGQVDIAPTVEYLLGVDENSYKGAYMGRVLINTNRNSTVIKGNEIIGNVKDEKEQKFLLNSYNIGEEIIENHYNSVEN
jgi:phosphoglycerol transferase MdoB-like AlkP superfamily enzyme